MARRVGFFTYHCVGLTQEPFGRVANQQPWNPRPRDGPHHQQIRLVLLDCLLNDDVRRAV